MPDAWESEPPAHGAADKRPLALLVAAAAEERRRLAAALAAEGIEALPVASVAAALAQLGAEPVALALVAEPGAAEACEALRAHAEGRALPILALLEREDAAAARRATEAGADDFALVRAAGALLGERVRLLLRAASSRAALRRTQERLEGAQRLARSGSFRIQLASGTLEGSLPLFELLGLAPRRGQHWKAFASHLHPNEREPLAHAVRGCLEHDRASALELRVLRADGAARWWRCRLIARRDLEGEPIALEGSVQDVTDGRQSEERAQSLAYQDELTQLGNRRLLAEKLGFVLRNVERFGPRLGVLALGLDRFERVSDTLGPAAGDALLREAGLRLLGSLRAAEGIDCRPEEITVARRSGGEFALLVPRVRDPQALATLARRALDALGHPFRLDRHEVSIGASVGIAVSPDDGSDGDTLLKNADAALHHTRQQDRGGHQFYRASMNATALSRLILESKLRRALEQGEFVLHYQPQLSLQSGAVTGFEGVVRWQEPELGLVGPDEFIPIAEETGLILPLGEWILREACRQIAAWRARGVCPVPISVNLSPHHFRSQDVAALVEAILAEHDTPGRRLGIEITENVLLHDPDVAIATLVRLRALGVKIALDDFGTGYSSLSYLRRLPADSLKLDRSFLAEIASEPSAAALTASIVGMGIALGLRVVAEGVEEEGQLKLLRAWGCHEAQGFLFGRPVPADEAERTWAGRAHEEHEEPAPRRL